MSEPKQRAYGGRSQEARVAERRERLMHAAARLYARVGAEGASVTAICAEAGLTARYFYESFPSRDALFLAVFREVTERLVAMMGEAGVTVDARLTGMFRALADHPELARVFLIDLNLHDPAVHEVGRAAGSAIAALLAPPGATPLAAAGVVGAVMRIARRWIEGGYGEPLEEAVAVARIFVEAALAAPR
ncbi:TetR/AcrR family transcriptional regulator [Flavisphingomonas formosensis]|uniref:TetR/AcrR family transcriptional regulator n=1 Tax=Flavisphingomonas formosensis TaxID=861534 RepID=UPI0012FAD19E|nr:TetR family transcriptional regulator [Sphingomonas formosensis]